MLLLGQLDGQHRARRVVSEALEQFRAIRYPKGALESRSDLFQPLGEAHRGLLSPGALSEDIDPCDGLFGKVPRHTQ